jgi:hypothetical protein
MFTQTLFFFGDFQGATGPAPTPTEVEFSTTYYYIASEVAQEAFSTDYYYNPTITE